MATLQSSIVIDNEYTGGGTSAGCTKDSAVWALIKRAREGAERYNDRSVQGNTGSAAWDMGQIYASYDETCKISDSDLDYVKRVNKRITDYEKANNIKNKIASYAPSKTAATVPVKKVVVKDKVAAVKITDDGVNVTVEGSPDYTMYYVGGAALLAFAYYKYSHKR